MAASEVSPFISTFTGIFPAVALSEGKFFKNFLIVASEKHWKVNFLFNFSFCLILMILAKLEKLITKFCSLSSEIFNWEIQWKTLQEKKDFFLRNYVERTEQTIFSLVFVCSRFTEISHFLDFPSKRKCKKAPSFRKCAFLRKYEIFVSNTWTWKWNFLCRSENKRIFASV